MAYRFASAIRQSLDEVFDGQRTGRYQISQLSKVEKTYIGTKIEIIIQAEFGLQRGQRMDYVVAGEEVDAKWSMRSGGWMIPTEAIGELCLCLTADDNISKFSVGLVRADEVLLRSSANKDKKRRFGPNGISNILWLVEGGELFENLLLHLDSTTRDAVLDYKLSGQGRINQLFRLVQGRLIHREVVLTVARQDDGPKRVRDARIDLRKEGILVLGHQGGHPAIARGLGLDPPPKGSWLSIRVVEGEAYVAGTVEIGSRLWRIGKAGEPSSPSPSIY